MPVIDKIARYAPQVIAAILAARQGPHAAAALLAGMQVAEERRRQQARQQQGDLAAQQQQQVESALRLAQEERAQAAEERASAAVSQTEQQAAFERFRQARQLFEPVYEGIIGSAPTEAQARGQAETELGLLAAQARVPPGQLRMLSDLPHKRQTAVRKAAEAWLAALQKQSGGESTPLVRYAGPLRELYTAEGIGMNPAEVAAYLGVSWPGAAALATTKEERAAQLLTKLKRARASGDQATAQKLQDEYDTLVEATRTLGEAGRSPIDPNIAALRDLQVQSARQAAEDAAATRQRQKVALQDRTQLVLEEIDRLLRPDKKDLTVAVKNITGLGRLALRQRIPGSPEADADVSLTRLGSQRVIDLIGEMKEQSRTGATGFGQLSERELAVLAEAATRLSTRQSPQALLDAVLQIRRLVLKSHHAAGGSYARTIPTKNPFRQD